MKKIIIIGGGPGGYVAAIRAAQLGANVELIENNKLGGTCLNVGCIPTKSLLHHGLFYKAAKSNAIAGVKFSDVECDWGGMQKAKNTVTRRLVGGVRGLLLANGVTIHKGNAKLISSSKVEVDGEVLPEADAIIIATGSRPVSLKFPGSDLDNVIDSTQALELASVPKSIAIVGGGVIGVEFASLFNALGSKVTIIEMMPKLLPPLDDNISGFMEESLKANDVDIYTNAKLISVNKGNEGELVSEIEIDDSMVSIDSELLLVAVGRSPNVEGIGLEENGIDFGNKGISVDENFETSLTGVYAIGDCNGKMMLAHAASAQGEAVVEYILNGTHSYNENIVPSCVYTEPEIASVGMTEKQAIEKNINYSIGYFDLSGNGKAKISGDGTGFVKIIAEKESREILGAHMAGPHVTEMIGAIALAITMKATVDDICDTIHAHPSVSESIREAALDVFGDSIHWPPKS